MHFGEAFEEIRKHRCYKSKRKGHCGIDPQDPARLSRYIIKRRFRLIQIVYNTTRIGQKHPPRFRQPESLRATFKQLCSNDVFKTKERPAEG